MTVFEYKDYKSFLSDRLGGKGARTGKKQQAARFLGCQPTFITQVLNYDLHLSLEQAVAISEFLSLSQEETRYFIMLLVKGRSGSTKLTAFADEELGSIRDARMSVSNRLGKTKQLIEVDQAEYYSSWLYGAVHMAVTIPRLQSEESLREYFDMEPSTVDRVIEFLLRTGLIRREGAKLLPGQTVIRIGRDSRYIERHHANWRLKAIASLEGETRSDLHYSGVMSLSSEDAGLLKNKILDVIKEHLAIVRQSKEEVLYVYNIDFFGLGR